MKPKTPIVVALSAGLFLTMTSTRATSSAPRRDSGEEPRAEIIADITAPSHDAVAVASGSDNEGELESSVVAIKESTRESDVVAPPPFTTADAHAAAPLHVGPYTLAETTSWMHVDPNLAASPWAGESILDRPEVFARAMKMYARPIDDATSATALSTAGFGSESNIDAIDVRVATIAHGEGDVTIGPRAVGVGADGTERAHAAAKVSLRDADASMTRGIPRSAVQAIVRQNFGHLSACSALSPLTESSNLRGRVLVRFVIGADGAVEVAQDAGSDLPDAAVVGCVVRRFLLFTFPPPDGGKVTVLYPLVFAPEESHGEKSFFAR